MEIKAEIPEFYAGKSVLVTGGSGFLGKVLIWKLLHSCPQIENIYVLIRPKWEKTMEDRKNELLKSPIFDCFRSTNPECLAKIKGIAGDVSEENLGLSDADTKTLTSNVSIVFHGAAILKMDASLKVAVNINTKGTFRCLNLAMKMKKLEVFVYVSTAYSCNEESHIEEKVYNFKYTPQSLMNLLDWLPQSVEDKITRELIEPLPNTYTLSKRLAELVSVDFEKKVPLVIARPTIVVSGLEEPIPGWTDNLNGLIGVCVCNGKGILHTVYANLEKKGDFVPVDIVCNTIITIPWTENKLNRLLSCVPVYNVAMFGMEQIKWGTFKDTAFGIGIKHPFDVILWYPTEDTIRSSLLVHKVEALFYHWVPAYLIDSLLYLLRQNTFMVRLHTKLSHGLKLLTYFTRREWSFQTDNVAQMKKMMTDADLAIFPVAFPEKVDVAAIMLNTMAVVKKNILHENSQNPERSRQKLKLFFCLKIVTKLIIYYLLFRILMVVFKMVSSFYETVLST